MQPDTVKRFRLLDLSCGLIAYLASLSGTLLLANERARPWAVFLLIGAAVLALIVWGQQEWMPAFPRHPITGITNFNRSRLFYLIGAIIAVSVVLAADLRYLAAPKATFGIAGGWQA